MRPRLRFLNEPRAMRRQSFFYRMACLISGIVVTVLMTLCSAQSQTWDVIRVPVVISGGHETDPRDHGRPVVLVAGGLGVSPEIFRDAFSRVHPVAPGSYPDQERAQQNKSVLLSALGKYGVTNENLDSVSNYYRYQPGVGHLWPTKTAIMTALVRNGAVISFEVTDGGAGYSSKPLISVPGAKCGGVTVNLWYGQNLQKNGSIGSVILSR